MPYLLQYYDGPQKWPFPQGVSAGPYRQFAGLGFYRPNQAMYRGMYPGFSRTLGATDISTGQIDLTDPTTLMWLGAGAILLWLLAPRAKRGIHRIRGTNPKRWRRYKRRSRRR